MTAILGISAFYHDSAAALIVDGHVVAAAQEERFSRRKHDASFPQNSIDYCLASAGLSPADVDFVGFYEKPFLKFERLIETQLATVPWGRKAFCHAMPSWLNEKLWISRRLHQGLGGKFSSRFVWAEHHESHAASAFFPSPFDSAAILTLDGAGEWSTGTIGVGRGNKIELQDEMRFPHSVGLLYSAMTYFVGFEVNAGEYKLMGLAPFGKPKYYDLILDQIVDLKPDGSFRLDLSYFDYIHGLQMTSEKMETLFGRSRRRSGDPITQEDCDLAASIQKVTEEIILRCCRYLRQRTSQSNLCLAGGVALNCVANSRVLNESGFENVWVQPAAGDAGGALGVAWLIWYQLLGHRRKPGGVDAQCGSLLGPRYSNETIQQLLDTHGIGFRKHERESDLCDEVAKLIADGKTVAWFQGRMEFGPRALGNRSIFGDPRRPEMQGLINDQIKFRESFRPFAPAVIEECARDYFELSDHQTSPYMLFVAQVQPQHRVPSKRDDAQNGLAQIQEVRSTIPSVTHVDGSARIQTVSKESNPRFYRLIRSFESQTDCPLLINTSFNVRDEPIVCHPVDAISCFAKTGLEILVLGNFIITQEQVRPIIPETERGADLKSVKKRMAMGFVGVNLAAAWLIARPLGASTGVFLGWTAASLILLASFWFSRRACRWTIRLWQPVSAAIGGCATRMLLTTIYGLIVVPIGWMMKLTSYDPLGRQCQRKFKTGYWMERARKNDENGYFKQY
jgi:carbamoyltransferase